MERRRGAGLASFFVDERPAAGAVARLGDAAVNHARVRRVAPGDAVRLTDGAGNVGLGTVERLDSRAGLVRVERCEEVARPESLTLLVPVADRERMLWLAEKAAELAVSDWRPVPYARSRSVSPRGEGDGFARKLRARMIGALEQSGGAWLPTVHPEASLDEAAYACEGVERRIVLDGSGVALPSLAPFHAAAVAFGPEGGLEPAELEMLMARGWRSASVGATTLRFETAGIAAAAIIRASQGR